jgi:hypothetical protein
MLSDFAFGTIGEYMPQLGELGVAVLFHQPGDVIAAAPAAGLALDREGRDAEIREGVGVVSHAGDPSQNGVDALFVGEGEQLE